jgi:branched-chain amino acid transport system substrate-binding protein
MFMKIFKKLTAMVMAVGVFISSSAFADTVKIAFIDPLSGPFATTGTIGLAEWKYAVEKLVNEKGGVLGGKKMEVVALDNKMDGKESLVQVQVAIDQGIRFIAQGNSSGIANAITDMVKKHNKRNPDKQVIFLNYSAVDPALTNDKCQFWHFRFDANADIKMDVITDVIAGESGIKKMYLIGQDYSFGKAVAAAAEKYLAQKTSIEIVGNELHPIGKVKDFTPYARKILASGADAVITGNWGADMVNLGRSLKESGFDGPVYCYYCATAGITKTFGATGKGMLNLVGEGKLNPVNPALAAYNKGLKAKYPEADMSQPRITNAVQMVAKAINEAGSATDMKAIAYALEGMEFENELLQTKVIMRTSDHQAIQDVHVGAHTDDVDIDFDNSGYGIKMYKTVKMASMDSPTSCKMKRP